MIFKRLKNNNALSITELMVAVSLVGIIMVGVVAVDLALRQNSSKGNREAQTSLRTFGMLNHISTRAALASGSATDRGVLFSPVMAANNSNFFCFREDPDIFVPNDATWHCYTRRTNDLHYCTRVEAVGAGSCGAGTDIVGEIDATIFSGNGGPGDNPSFVVDNTLGVQDHRFSIFLTSRWDSSLPEDRFNNPEITVSTSISPSAHNF